MFPQPKPVDYSDVLSAHLFRAVPEDALVLVEMGCGQGRLGAALKDGRPDRHVIGVELDPASAATARTRLDEVFECDIQVELPPLGPGTVDAVLFGDVLGHLLDPEAALRGVLPLLSPRGVVVASVPNVGHHSVLRSLLRSDFQYQPLGILDDTHLRFFTHATLSKLFLDSGFLPDLVDTTVSPADVHTLRALEPLQHHFRVDPSRARRHMEALQYVVVGRPWGQPDAQVPTTPLTFLVCVNDGHQLASNLLRSPCLAPGSPHQLVQLPGQRSAGAGFAAGLEQAEHDLVVLVQQDIYLPAGWDRRFADQLALAEQRFGRVGVAGVFGFDRTDDVPTHVGRVVDRDRLLDRPTPLPARVDSLDEILLAVHRDSGLRLDPALGWHLYGADLVLQAQRAGLEAVVLDAPLLHNSLFSRVEETFHHAREVLLDKWPDVRPFTTNMGRLDTMRPTPPTVTWDVELLGRVRALEARLVASEERTRTAEARTSAAETDRDRARADRATARARLQQLQARVARMEQSVFWRARRVLRRR